MIEEQRPSITELMARFDEVVDEYEGLCGKLQTLLVDILAASTVRVHNVTARVKDRASFAAKINKSDGKYIDVSDVTDLSGIRVITYFNDDVDRVAQLIEAEFDIDPVNSSDRGSLLDPDTFGYLSLHYVVSLPDRRTALREYTRYAGLKAEIQVRSILQHAWAEIEHDLGYKTELGVPREIRRRFSRLAGLLEIGDQEFAALRDELKSYEDDLPARIASGSNDVLLDKASLEAFLTSDPTIIRLSTKIGDLVGAAVDDVADFQIESQVAPLALLGIDTIGELHSALRDLEEPILAFATKWLTPFSETYESVAATVSLMYLGYVVVGERRDEVLARRFLDVAVLGAEEERTAIAAKIFDTYREMDEA